MEPAAPRRTRTPGTVATDSDVERSIRTCPNCGRALLQRSCKLLCTDPACGFFLSCADYL